MTNVDVYDDLYLYKTYEKLYVEAVDAKVLLSFDRDNYRINLHVGTASQIGEAASRKKIWGIMGIIRLLSCRYLLVITEAEKVGTIAGHTIYRIAGSEMVRYETSSLHLSEKQWESNETYVEMIQTVLNTPHFYFSYTYDLSHRMQKLHNTTPEFLQKTGVIGILNKKKNVPLIERADPRFIWNAYLLRELTHRQEHHKFCLPIIHGFVSLNTFVVNGIPFNWGIISRRSVNRAGTRLFSRGVDRDGNVSNFVEVEQILEVNGDRSSFVQTRGSIPLFWSQYPNLKYKPKPQLSLEEDHVTACARHLDAQIFHYGRQILVNLIDHHGSEGVLQETFRRTVHRLNYDNVRYEAFDFHAECKKMRYDRLNILMDRLTPDLEQIGYFLLTKDGALLSVQDGVFRTNCIDCLDRTNVVQSMIAKRVLNDVLNKLGVLQRIEEYPALEHQYKQVWADNADVISTQYSGTGALKTDFTRTGKRTKKGVLNDGWNSLTRYFKNNFADGFRQDAISLFLGRYIVKDDEWIGCDCPLATGKSWRYVTFPIVLLIASSMLVAHIIMPSNYTTEILLYMLFWAAMIAGTLATIMHHGHLYVDNPKLGA